MYIETIERTSLQLIVVIFSGSTGANTCEQSQVTPKERWMNSFGSCGKDFRHPYSCEEADIKGRKVEVISSGE